jgi:hypothetical protein
MSRAKRLKSKERRGLLVEAQVALKGGAGKDTK